MRFATLFAAIIIADAIRSGYQPQSKWMSAVIVLFIGAFLYADTIEFYQKVWKR